MVDYTKSTGSTGTMMIRDTGTRVEMWLKAGSATYNHNLQWGFTINGLTDNNRSFDFQSGGAWQKLGSWVVNTTQNVVFRLEDSGTAGLGGPTTLSHVIDRSTVPDAPSKPTLVSSTNTSVTVVFTDGGNGGEAIDGRQHGISLSTGNPTAIRDAPRQFTWGALEPGTRYYFRARTHNVNGWSAWSGYNSYVTLDVPTTNVPTLSNITQTSVHVKYTDGDDHGAPPLERQVGWSASSTGNPTATKNAPGGEADVSGLVPGTVYYFRSRNRNSVGWGPWSAARSTKTTPGAFVKVGGVWRPAVPYVKVGGVWKVSRPWARIFGFWEESS